MIKSSLRLPSSTSSRDTTRKTVHWYRRCKVRFVPTPSSEEEKQAAWYHCSEIYQFKEQSRNMIRLARDHGQEAVQESFQDDDVRIGLKDFKARKLKRQRQHDALFAVLEEQRYQQMTAGVCQPAAIASRYFNVTREAQKEAHVRAVEIAKIGRS